MKKKKKISKKIVIALFVIVVLVGVGIGALVWKGKSNNAAYVATVEEINNTWMLQNNGAQGMIGDAASQSVHLDSASEVAELYVEEGQEVKKGDVLFRYDMNSLQDELEVAKLTSAAQNNQLQLAKTKLTRYENLPVRSSQENAQVSGRIDEINKRMSQLQVLIEETDEKLYQIEIAMGQNANGSTENGNTTEDMHASGTGDDESGVSNAELEKAKKELAENLAAYEQELARLETELDAITEDAKNYYTQDAKDAMIANQKVEIRRIEISMRTSDLEIANLQKKIADAFVVAEMDGVVSHIAKDDKEQDGSAYMTIMATMGLSVIGYVDEYSLDTIKIGDKISVSSWEDGSQAVATIMEISSYPTSNYQSYTYGNNNFSYYAYTAYMEDAGSFLADQWVSISPYEEGDSIVLERVYVRHDDEGEYVLVDNGAGKLERRQVSTKSCSEADYIQITDGLSLEDKIAFPYGKSAFEGNMTTTEQPFSIF